MCPFFVLLFLNMSLWNAKCENMFFVCWPSLINSRKGRKCPNMGFLIDFFLHTFLISRLLPSPYPYWGDEEDVQSPPRDPFVG